MNTPDRSTAAAFPKYLTGEVVADSIGLKWSGLFARRWRLPRVVDRLLVPATPEPHISCNLRGIADFQERDVGGAWITRRIGEGDLFVTRSRTPYEVRFESPRGQELDNLSLHIAVEPFLTALEARFPGRTLFFGSSLFATIILVFLWGAGFGPIPPAWSTWVAKKVPEHAETGGGLYVAAVQSSAAIGASLGGYAFDLKGSTAVFLMCFLSWAISALLVYRKISPASARTRRSAEVKRIESLIDFDEDECFEIATTRKGGEYASRST